MKAVSLFVLFTLSLFSLQAQTEFAPPGAKWTYTFADHVPFSYTHRSIEASVEAVEMFQGRMCSRLELWATVPPYDTPVEFWAGTTIYLYEESDSVFFWSPYSGQFELLYDFNAEVGDSWVIGGLEVPDPEYEDHMTVHIDSISTLDINGETLKVWHHAPDMYFDWGNTIIEGIGSNSFLIPSFGLYESRLGSVRCFAFPPKALQFVSHPCDSVLYFPIASVNEVPAIGIELFPNPVMSELNISTHEPHNSGIVNIEIIDLEGRVLLTERITPPGSIGLSHLSAGVYVCRVALTDGRIGLGRILKMR